MTEHHTTSAPRETATAAGIYNYVLSGRSWTDADRAAAEGALATLPILRSLCEENRAFMRRAVATLAREHGVRQFLDIGGGIPLAPNLHEVVQESEPTARVLYVDNDPVVLAHADELPPSTPLGSARYLYGDFLGELLTERREVRETLDLTQPVALSLLGFLHFMPPEAEPRARIARMMAELPSGSFLVLNHATEDYHDQDLVDRAQRYYRDSGIAIGGRSRAEFAEFFEGLELLEPGIVSTHRWRPDGPLTHTDRDVASYGGVARKP